MSNKYISLVVDTLVWSFFLTSRILVMYVFWTFSKVGLSWVSKPEWISSLARFVKGKVDFACMSNPRNTSSKIIQFLPRSSPKALASSFIADVSIASPATISSGALVGDDKRVPSLILTSSTVNVKPLSVAGA